MPAVVELPDTNGVRVIGNMVDVRPSEVRIGLDVELVWRDVRDGTSVPTFRPARAPRPRRPPGGLPVRPALEHVL